MATPDLTQSSHVDGQKIDTESSLLRQRLLNSPRVRDELDKVVKNVNKFITEGIRSNKSALRSITHTKSE